MRSLSTEYNSLAMTRIVRALADSLCGGRLCFVLEGGYAPSGLAEGTTALLDGLLEAPGVLPASVDAPTGSTLRAVVDRVAAAQRRYYPGIGAA